jgi:hypothetical protein
MYAALFWRARGRERGGSEKDDGVNKSWVEKILNNCYNHFIVENDE